ncbi:MAG: serine hydrolase domain-containing protein [Oceanicaulis sp.]
MAIPQNDPELCGIAWANKVIASGVFHTGRDPQEIFSFSCNWMAAPEEMMRAALQTKKVDALLALKPDVVVDKAEGLVSTTLFGRTAYARLNSDQGVCVVDGPDAPIHFTPRVVPRRAPAKGAGWPAADPVEIEPGATGLAPKALEEAKRLAFANTFEFTNALVVLHKGRVVLEHYRDPFDRETRFESWSMGKSIAATLAGVAIRSGDLSLDEDHLFDAWTGREDPRRKIKLRNLLNMASGLEFTGSFGREEDHAVKQKDGLFLDHIYVYASGVDSHGFCLDKPLADKPGTAGRYRNCDPLLTMALVRDRCAGGDVERFLSWPQERLYDRIGSTGMVLETDPYGNFLISGHDYGRAMDWARLGQLHLNRGAWGGDQIFDERFAEFVRTPARKAWKHDLYYGGFFPTNATGLIPTLPRDAFWMSGGGLQRVVIVPSLDLVIVRLGHMAGTIFGVDKTLNEVYRLLAEAASRA